MNRAEARRASKAEAKKAKVYRLTQEQIDKIKEDAVQEAMDRAFILMIGLSVMVIHDHFGELIRKVVDGKNREERFTDILIDLWMAYDDGRFFTLDDVRKMLKDECGIDFMSDKAYKALYGERGKLK